MPNHSLGPGEERPDGRPRTWYAGFLKIGPAENAIEWKIH